MAKRRNSDVSIERIEGAALKLFSAKGYSNTSLEEVATMAGFTKGAVYYHFKTKEILLLHILDRIRQRSIRSTAETIASLQSGAIEKLVAFVNTQAGWAAKYPDDLAILIMTTIESFAADSKIRGAILDFYALMQELLTKIITEGKKRGELPKSLAVDSAVLATIARHDGNMLLWHRSGRDPKVGRVLTAAARDAVIQLGQVNLNQ
jgi:AcrR family transcriptional regulator